MAGFDRDLREENGCWSHAMKPFTHITFCPSEKFIVLWVYFHLEGKYDQTASVVLTAMMQSLQWISMNLKTIHIPAKARSLMQFHIRKCGHQTDFTCMLRFWCSHFVFLQGPKLIEFLSAIFSLSVYAALILTPMSVYKVSKFNIAFLFLTEQQIWI